MQENQSIELLINKAKKDFLVREKIFHEYRPQIKSIATSICKRPLNWDNDDELSISLIAFNEAIDTYDESKGMSFISYARMLIHNRLVDYFRRESRFNHQSLDVVEEDQQINEFEKEQACNDYRQDEANTNLRETIEVFNKVISEYDISLDDLVDASPKHKDTRNRLLKVAQSLVKEPILLSKLITSKKLPIKELILYTGVSRRVLERGRKYVIAIALILSDKEFSGIKNFIDFSNIEGGEVQ